MNDAAAQADALALARATVAAYPDRAGAWGALADRLLDSLSSPPASPLHPAWQAELARRSAELDAGTATAIPWEEVRRQAWQEIDQAKKPPHG